MSLCKIQGKAEKEKGIHYEFDSEHKPLGEGGMGKVYKGRCVDERTGISHDVAIKFIYSEVSSQSPYAVEKARREACIHFKHDNLVEMLGFIETSEIVLGETEHHYHVVSELLEGVSLDNLMSGRLIDQEGYFVPFADKLYNEYLRNPNQFAITIVKNILKGLMSMHDEGYIHRDIDPTNIMITSDGHIKLIDFGIAKKMNSLSTKDKPLTKAGQFVGKAEYAAPELVVGAVNEQNQTTDIYAVGILLYQCIVGKPPFTGDTNDVLQKQRFDPLPLKQIKHKGLRKIIATATEKSREKRYQSAAEFRVALERVDLYEPEHKWEPLYNYIIGAVAACGIIAYILFPNGEFKLFSKGEVEETLALPVVDETISYTKALTFLHDEKTAGKGKKALDSLSNSGDAKATFLLSRLYFEGKQIEDNPDSIREMRQLLNLKVDNVKAHDFLELAVEQDSQNYKYIFELAMDWWGGDMRAEGLPERSFENADKADSLLQIVRQYASYANDVIYINKVDEYLKDIRRN